jgi:hypothetical protein
MRCGTAEISFSGEMHGWQVAVEGSGEFENLIATITERMAAEVGEPCEWLRIA